MRFRSPNFVKCICARGSAQALYIPEEEEKLKLEKRWKRQNKKGKQNGRGWGRLLPCAQGWWTPLVLASALYRDIMSVS